MRSSISTQRERERERERSPPAHTHTIALASDCLNAKMVVMPGKTIKDTEEAVECSELCVTLFPDQVQKAFLALDFDKREPRVTAAFSVGIKDSPTGNL